MNEHEARALNRTSEEWEKRIDSAIDEADDRKPTTSARDDYGMTMRELLGAEFHDAILDVVAE